jgi:hypothetical protein
MIHLPKSQLVWESVRFRNPRADLIVVWLEPWSERFELAPQTALDVAFVGPSGGFPEVMPRPDGLSVYGWVGSEFIALQNSRVAGRQPTVDEIVRQELDIAKESVERSAAPLPVDDIANAQILFDQDPEVNPRSQSAACDAAARLAIGLAGCFVRSEASRLLIWEIARQLVRTRGLFLADLEQGRESELWTRGPFGVAELIFECSISAVPSHPSPKGLAAPDSKARPQPAETESGAAPR